MAKMVHSMIRVLEETRSVDFYDKAFGLKVASRVPFDGFTLIYLSNPETGFELELTVNAGREQAYDLGNGYGHLAVTVEDIEAEYTRFTDLSLTVGKLVEMPHEGKPFARFFFVTDPDGYKTEVIQRGGRFQ
ncbi:MULTISPECIES: VOC family protein [Rhizobiaceae]|jgi:lactoylglutathione lyase|uniref:Aldoketomutase n=1 Tax=Aliirhizobium cellulosilyticum TaxID=393664 RepID=A0A7W6UW13_9HYPH|nr:VOC family protein [Rhizobium cellulosilyticum]MBB4346871.1 lactoylglutathione lyase [Rhizobium cellulosilyticum]MBB4410735.1 lactoylglutathione lyase [Rhizobium cellulosilyticum]MBB4445423.1 lactoylglutathione lyase [Rhizobium cellulosilyticum]